MSKQIHQPSPTAPADKQSQPLDFAAPAAAQLLLQRLGEGWDFDIDLSFGF